MDSDWYRLGVYDGSHKNAVHERDRFDREADFAEYLRGVREGEARVAFRTASREVARTSRRGRHTQRLRRQSRAASALGLDGHAGHHTRE